MDQMTRCAASKKTNHILAVWFRAGICDFDSFFAQESLRECRPHRFELSSMGPNGGGHRQIGYWVGRMLCVKPIVLIARSMGVNGGSKLGVRKSVSNL